MNDAPKIKTITVALDDGKTATYTAADIQAIREFTNGKFWTALEYLTSLKAGA